MKVRITSKLVILMVLAVGAGYWAGYVHGSTSMRAREIFIGLALLLVFVLVVVKAVCAIVLRAGHLPPSSDGGGGPRPPGAPVPHPPGGRPPALSAAAKVSREPAD